MNVTATDHGITRLSSHTMLIINIIDVNEENPRFSSMLYNAELSENSQRGSFVFQLSAVKSLVRRRLTYSFTHGKNEFFNIDDATVCDLVL